MPLDNPYTVWYNGGMINNQTPTLGEKDMTSEIIFTMGLPAAGKSTWTNQMSGYTVLDPDAVKESHPEYDPANPHALHAWSQDVIEGRWQECLSSKSGKWIVDGTGTNSEKMVRRIKQAEAAGYSTKLVYVTCSLETSLARNAARERHVPESVIRNKALDISTSFEIVSEYVDCVVVVDNN